MRPSHKNQKSFPKNTFSESHCQTDPRQFAAQLVLSAYYEASPRSLSYGFGLYIHSKLTSNSSTELWLTNHTLQLYTLNPQKKKKERKSFAYFYYYDYLFFEKRFVLERRRRGERDWRFCCFGDQTRI